MALLYPIHHNDSVYIEQFLTHENVIFSTIDDFTTLNNKITIHFRKYISGKDLKSIEFNKERRNVHIDFQLNRNKEPIKITTNAPTVDLDEKIKKAFNELDFSLLKIVEFNSSTKYTLIVIQNYGNTPSVRCNTTAIGYTPPVYIECKEEFSYDGINKCNYLYLTEFLYNAIDLNFVKAEDLQNDHQMNLKFIVSPQGHVTSSIISSQNQRLLNSYQKAVNRLPKAKFPAKLNGENFYYCYIYPTSIKNIVRNNNHFKNYYNYKKHSGMSMDQIMMEYLIILDKARRKNLIYRDGF